MTFKVGDNVVYPLQGAGVIAEKVTRRVLGETHEYLKIIFIKGDMDVLVPLKKGQEIGLRHTVSSEEVGKLHDAIHKGDLDLPSNWPPRYRAEQDILAAGDAFDLASMVGVLAKRDLEKGLAATERQVLEDAKSALASELAVVLKVPLEEAKAQLEATLELLTG